MLTAVSGSLLYHACLGCGCCTIIGAAKVVSITKGSSDRDLFSGSWIKNLYKEKYCVDVPQILKTNMKNENGKKKGELIFSSLEPKPLTR